MICSAYNLEFTQTCGDDDGGSGSGGGCRSSNSSIQKQQKYIQMKMEHATNKTSTWNNNKTTIYIKYWNKSSISQKQWSVDQKMGFLKMSTSLNTRLAAKMYVGDRQFLQVMENMEVLKSYGRTLISHISKRGGQHIQPELTDDDGL